MNDIQKLIWFGRVLRGNAPEDQKKIARKAIVRLLDTLNSNDRENQITGLKAILEEISNHETQR